MILKKYIIGIISLGLLACTNSNDSSNHKGIEKPSNSLLVTFKPEKIVDSPKSVVEFKISALPDRARGLLCISIDNQNYCEDNSQNGIKFSKPDSGIPFGFIVVPGNLLKGKEYFINYEANPEDKVKDGIFTYKSEKNILSEDNFVKSRTLIINPENGFQNIKGIAEVNVTLSNNIAFQAKDKCSANTCVDELDLNNGISKPESLISVSNKFLFSLLNHDLSPISNDLPFANKDDIKFKIRKNSNAKNEKPILSVKLDNQEEYTKEIGNQYDATTSIDLQEESVYVYKGIQGYDSVVSKSKYVKLLKSADIKSIICNSEQSTTCTYEVVIGKKLEEGFYLFSSKNDTYIFDIENNSNTTNTIAISFADAKPIYNSIYKITKDSSKEIIENTAYITKELAGPQKYNISLINDKNTVPDYKNFYINADHSIKVESIPNTIKSVNYNETTDNQGVFTFVGNDCTGTAGKERACFFTLTRENFDELKKGTVSISPVILTSSSQFINRPERKIDFYNVDDRTSLVFTKTDISNGATGSEIQGLYTAKLSLDTISSKNFSCSPLKDEGAEFASVEDCKKGIYIEQNRENVREVRFGIKNDSDGNKLINKKLKFQVADDTGNIIATGVTGIITKDTFKDAIILKQSDIEITKDKGIDLIKGTHSDLSVSLDIALYIYGSDLNGKSFTSLEPNYEVTLSEASNGISISNNSKDMTGKYNLRLNASASASGTTNLVVKYKNKTTNKVYETAVYKINLKDKGAEVAAVLEKHPISDLSSKSRYYVMDIKYPKSIGKFYLKSIAGSESENIYEDSGLKGNQDVTFEGDNVNIRFAINKDYITSKDIKVKLVPEIENDEPGPESQVQPIIISKADFQASEGPDKKCYGVNRQVTSCQ